MRECGAGRIVRSVYGWQMAAEAMERGDEKGAQYWTRIAELIDNCPPLTDEQIVELRAIFAETAAKTRPRDRPSDDEA